MTAAVPPSQDLPTPDHPNAIRIRQAKECVVPGKDIDPMFAVQAPDMIAHIPGTSLIAGEWRSRDALAAAVRSLGALAGGTLYLTANVVATDDFAINVQRLTGRREDGRSLNTVLTEVWRMQDGVCVEIWDHFQDLDAWDAFWR
ncbi:nuclear transport factor 2 family protein [Leptolyngbya sp. FACHB-261]|uniref:nuclear transport factor 2 family protein n=1 Tax=Leptolyngbya sp. FACHB-261 TaxID=2692806 RepID=UPI0016898DE2|nr:nuclear transport factor 2 family protein [Leptolyngbya sp. FACHB-261]MBD2100179.1 nuclear transport factor 2 family protein [Leptolyngbya sp. FACHB-261]